MVLPLLAVLTGCESEAEYTAAEALTSAQVFFDNLDSMENWSMTECSEPQEDNGYTIRFTTYTNSRVLPLGDRNV